MGGAQVLLAAGWLLGPSPASSHPELRLSWEAPEVCPSREVVEERVAGSLGRPLGESEGPTLRVDARVTEQADRLRLTLRTETAEGVSEREMFGQSCEVLVDAAALVVAVTLDPARLGEDPTAMPTEIPTEPAAIAPGDATCPEPSGPAGPIVADSDPSPPLAGTVRVAATGSLGPLPTPAPGLEIAVAVLRARLRVELGFDYFFARRAALAPGDDRAGEIQLWTITTRGCGVPSVSIVEFPLCAGLQAGPMRGEGRGLASPSTTRLAWVAAEVGGAVVVRGLPLVDVWLGVDLVVPLTRPGFAIDDLGPVHRSAAVGGEAALGLEVRFGPGRH